MKLDLKYVVTLVLAIAGVSLTVWYAYQPPESGSLTLEVTSKTLLSTTNDAGAPGLTVLVDGKEVNRAAFTSLVLRNSGNDPVRSRDFESAIEVELNGSLDIVRAIVDHAEPNWLDADVAFEGVKLLIKPLLLNPGDNVTFHVLSDGLPESVKARSRVAGVKSILVLDAHSLEPSRILAYLGLVGAYALTIPMVGLWAHGNPFPPASFLVARKLWAGSFLALLFVVIGLTTECIEQLGFSEWWHQMVAIFALWILAMPFALWLKRLPEDEQPKNDQA